MKKHQRFLRGCAALLCAVLLLTGNTAPAMAAKVTQADIDALKNDASNLDKQQKEIQSKLSDLKDDKAAAVQKKSLLDDQIANTAAKISNTESQISDYNTLITQAEAELADAQQREEAQYELFCKRVREMEEQGTVSYWSVLFKATSFSDLVSRIDFINEIVRYNQQVIKNLRDTRQQLADDKAALEEQNESLTASKKELEGEISESMRLLAEYIKTEEGKQAEYDAIKAEEEALDDLMAAAEAKARELGLNDIAGTVGGYIWPCNGIRWITSMFGGRQSPGGIGSTNHKGVDIGTPMGTPVLAAKSGTVTWASWNGGYGNCIIISHGNGNSTLYGHLSGYNVSTDQQVTQGQVIGYSGNTGNSTGPHLHFGIIENNSWIDPLNYLTGWQYYG